MRRVLHLLTMMCLLWCALGVAEPAGAQDHGAAQVRMLDAAPATTDDGTATPEPGHHQHCPVAPDLHLPASGGPATIVALAPLAPRCRALASLTRAPPLQPPAA